jgi:DNA-binding LytR/AlgR family response regulator
MNLNPINFYVVEDEPQNREGLIQLINEGNHTQVTGAAGSVDAAFNGIIETHPDALLLDIKLIGGDAFQLLQRLIDAHFPIPPSVLITGHLEFSLAQEALNRFRDHIVYIIQKPFLENWEEKFQNICQAIKVYYSRNDLQNTIASNEPVLFLRSGKATHRISVNEIEYIEVGGKGSVIIYTDLGKKVKIYLTLHKFLDQVPPSIVRIHRKYAIHRDKVSHIDHEDRLLYLTGIKKGLDIGEVFYPKILEILAE